MKIVWTEREHPDPGTRQFMARAEFGGYDFTEDLTILLVELDKMPGTPAHAELRRAIERRIQADVERYRATRKRPFGGLL